MAKITGYILAIIAVIIIILNSQISNALKLKPVYIIFIGIVLAIIGIFFVMQSGTKGRQVSKEVPIYQGEGRKRKIIGYKREK